MALSTYSDLTTSIANWLGRPGDTNLPVDDFVTIFEDDASTKLRTHYQEVTATITTAQGTVTYNLPADFQEPREVSITSTDPVRVLTYLTPAELDDIWDFDTQFTPINYTLEASTIRFGPIPDSAYTVRLEYFQNLTPLINGLNWLYINYPSCYLYGSLVPAYLFLGGDEADTNVQKYIALRDDLYDKIKLQDRKYRTGSAPLQMRIDRRRR